MNAPEIRHFPNPAEAMLLSKGLTFSSHSAVVATYGKEFAKTGLLDPKFHRDIIDAQECREIDIMATKAKKSRMSQPWKPIFGQRNLWKLWRHTSMQMHEHAS
jgi:hypothetical protein